MKNIYISHSRLFDYKNELYTPLLKASTDFEFLFPHLDSNTPFLIKEDLKNKKVDFVLAEVSYPSTGQGIELAWAEFYSIPIVCIYKSGMKYSGSLTTICQTFIEYTKINKALLNTILNK